MDFEKAKVVKEIESSLEVIIGIHRLPEYRWS